MVTDSSRPAGARFEPRSRLGAFGRALACLSLVVLPALLMAAPPAQSAMLTNVAPRLPTNIGPRGPMIDSIGPRFDPSLHSGGNGQTGGNGNNAGTSSGGS